MRSTSVPFTTRWPSSHFKDTARAGSVRRKTSRATGSPASTRSPLAMTRAVIDRSGTAAVVQSWVPQSSRRKAPSCSR